MTEPAWLARARSYIGFHETGNNRGIEKFIESAHTGSLGDPWCAIFVNACLEESGIHGTRSPAARSFEHDSNFKRLETPQLGCIVTLWRVSPNSGQGHVGFYLDEVGDSVEMLSGNDDDQVEIALHPQSRVTGYWWPVSEAAPTQLAISTGKASWYGQHSGKYVWRDPGDAPNSNALGVPDEQQGCAFYNHATLGHWFNVTAPNGKTLRLRQTDIGPHPKTDRLIDIHAVAAERFGYSPQSFPTDSYFSWTAADAPPTEPHVPTQPQLPPPTPMPEPQIVLTPEQFEAYQKRMRPKVLPLINMVLALLPQLGTWGIVATQILAFLQMVPAIPNVSTNGPATSVITFLGMIASWLISKHNQTPEKK